MIEVTQEASKQIAEYFKDKEKMPVRVFLNSGGWGGPSLAMALDESKDTDEIFEVDGFEYIADKEFLKQATPVKIDFLQTGFKIDSAIDLGPGCGGSCSEGSCG